MGLSPEYSNEEKVWLEHCNHSANEVTAGRSLGYAGLSVGELLSQKIR